jgi:hypothetical protein
MYIAKGRPVHGLPGSPFHALAAEPLRLAGRGGFT